MQYTYGIPTETTHSFFNRSLRFMDTYRKGLTGVQAAWASRRYRGHRKLPDSIMAELDRVGLGEAVIDKDSDDQLVN